MTYEFCAIARELAPTPDAGIAAWNEESYIASSLPQLDQGARKWRVKEALLAFNSELEFITPEEPPSGFFAKLFHKPRPDMRNLTVNLYTGDDGTTFTIYDQAVEVTLPWSPQADLVERTMREAWRHLKHLVQLGYVIYDTERGVLLDLAIDFDAALGKYLDNIQLNGVPQAQGPTPAPPVKQGAGGSKPFTGNVE